MSSSISPWNKIVEGNMMIQYHFLSASTENIIIYHMFWKYTAFYAKAFVSPKQFIPAYCSHCAKQNPNILLE